MLRGVSTAVFTIYGKTVPWGLFGDCAPIRVLRLLNTIRHSVIRSATRICTFQRYFSILKLLCTFGTYLYGISYRPESPRGTLDPGTFGVPPEPIYMEFRTLLNVPQQSRPAFEGLGTQDREWCPVYGPHHSGSHVGDLGQGPPVEWGF